jgi:hypothetical protein
MTDSFHMLSNSVFPNEPITRQYMSQSPTASSNIPLGVCLLVSIRKALSSYFDATWHEEANKGPY